MMAHLSPLQTVLWLIAIYHIVMGAGALLSADAAQWLAATFFGIRLKLEPQTAYVVKLLGVYVLMFGLVVAVAAETPERYGVLLNLTTLLYALRIANKLAFSKLYQEAFDAPPKRVWMDVIMLAGFGAAVFFLK